MMSIVTRNPICVPAYRDALVNVISRHRLKLTS